MQPESPKLLDDIRTAAAYILDKTRGKSLVDYASDDILRPLWNGILKSSVKH